MKSLESSACNINNKVGQIIFSLFVLRKDYSPKQVPGIKEPTQVAGIKEPTQVPGIEEPTQVPGIEEPTQVPGIEEPTQVPGKHLIEEHITVNCT